MRLKRKESKVRIDKQSKTPHRYNICNGLSNQLLHHASSIAYAIQHGLPVEIPNRYLIDGVQHTNSDVLPTEKNSVPLMDVFDSEVLLKQIKEFGIEATFVEPDFKKGKNQQMECAGFGKLSEVDERVVLRLLQSFEPSGIIKDMAEEVLKAIKAQDLDLSEGVCVHHRDGADWHSHCGRWSSIDDGIYRGNCLLEPQSTFLESLEARALTIKSRWVYYSGDKKIPLELNGSPHVIVSKDDYLSPETMVKVNALRNSMGKTGVRDLWSLLDYAVCKSLPYFVGNSVSTWSALQLAFRDGLDSYWYNSQSIPLSMMWNAFQIPIVYTFTELSAPLGKYMLQASITSVRKHMPHNKIHILYHGESDTDFRSWLAEHNVIVHDHHPEWRADIEKMRQNGNPHASHLFLHEGNYLGTWQRIDIPKFIHSEYVLFLDADTIVKKPFTLADFGHDITRSIAFGPESEPDSRRPFNAGVGLLNIPTLRKTYKNFLKLIMKHVDGSVYKNGAPSDQGAYLEFYSDVKFLEREFNFKPYYRLQDSEFDNAKIVHFHGPKPHQYLGHVLGIKCDQATQAICDASVGGLIGRAEKTFAQALVDAGTPVLQEYCNAAYQKDQYYADFCALVMQKLADMPDSDCKDFGGVVQHHKMSFDQEQNEKLIATVKRLEELEAKYAEHKDNEKILLTAFSRSETLSANLTRQNQILTARVRRSEAAEMQRVDENEKMLEFFRLEYWTAIPFGPENNSVIEIILILLLLLIFIMRKHLIRIRFCAQVRIPGVRRNRVHTH